MINTYIQTYTNRAVKMPVIQSNKQTNIHSPFLFLPETLTGLDCGAAALDEEDEEDLTTGERLPLAADFLADDDDDDAEIITYYIRNANIKTMS